jgi:flagellin
MPQIINTNIASINAQRNLNESQLENQTALQRLSSGLRINSARDDAAGLAISTRFDAQIEGTQQATRNAQDGISLAQTAEGALDTVIESLLRIRELALQSANGTNDSTDREALNLEVQQLIDEIQRVAEDTTFNGQPLLDGSFSGTTFQIGPNNGDTIDISVSQMTTDVLGAGQTAGISSLGSTSTAASTSPNALSSGDLIINGVTIGTSSGADDTFSAFDKSGSAIAKVAAINEKTDETGVVAEPLSNELQGVPVSGGAYSTQSGTFRINNVEVTVATDANLDANVNRESIVAAINAVQGLSGVEAINTGSDSTGIRLVAQDGRNITLNMSDVTGSVAGGTLSAADLGLGSNATASSVNFTTAGGFVLNSITTEPIVIDGDNDLIENVGINRGTYEANIASVTSLPSNSNLATGTTASANANFLTSGDLVINGVTIPSATANDDQFSFSGNSATSLTAVDDSWVSSSAIAKAAAINKASDQTGVDAEVLENVVVGTDQTAGGGVGSIAGGTVTINGVAVTISTLDTNAGTSQDEANAEQNRLTAINAINSIAGQTGVMALDTGSEDEGIRLVAEDGRNIVVELSAASLSTAIGISGHADPNEPAIFVGAIQLSGAKEFELRSTTGNIETNAGLRVGFYGGATDGQFLEDIDISTVEGALEALAAVDNAINTVNFQRADLGAYMNRFESTIQNLQISNENLSASNSRIRDADYAQETAELSRTNILQQAGISVLSQANSQPEQVLSLLQ